MYLNPTSPQNIVWTEKYHSYIMFPTPAEVILVFSILMMIVKSIPSPIAEDLFFNPDDIPTTDLFTNDLSNVDYLSASIEPTDLLNLDPIPDSDLLGNNENLLAGNHDFCRAEDMSLLPAIGRLRARGETHTISERNEACRVQTQLENPPAVQAAYEPNLQKRADICPPEIYQNRQIPLCSSGDPTDVRVIEGFTMLLHTTPCKSLSSLWALSTGSDVGCTRADDNNNRNPFLLTLRDLNTDSFSPLRSWGWLFCTSRALVLCLGGLCRKSNSLSQ